MLISMDLNPWLIVVVQEVSLLNSMEVYKMYIHVCPDLICKGHKCLPEVPCAK